MHTLPVLDPSHAHRAHAAHTVASPLGAARRVIERVGACTDWDQALHTALQALRDHLGIAHSAILWGPCASTGLRRVAQHGQAPRAPKALPLQRMGQVVGLLLVDAPEAPRPGLVIDEDALASIAVPLALSLSLLEPGGCRQDTPTRPPAAQEAVIEVRHHAPTGSTFLNGRYLVRGVAGAILWKMVREASHHGRHEFCNRELRLDPALRLPEVADNLETRLILLRRRLADHQAPLQLDKIGRGRLALRWQGQLQPIEA
jgi:hypothetical protein